MSYRLPQGTALEEAQDAATNLSPQDLAYFRRGLSRAWDAAAQGGAAGFVPSGAALALPPASVSLEGGCERENPEVYRGIAFGRSHVMERAQTPALNSNPLDTAVMGAIANVAEKDKEVGSKFSMQQYQGQQQQQLTACTDLTTGLDQRSQRRSNAPYERKVACESETGGGGLLEEITKGKRRRGGEEEDLLQPQQSLYICTGCDAFLTHEPCIGDAMALVHARVSRVVFAVPAEKGEGAFLGWGASGLKLHALKALNHHFRVYAKLH